MDLFERSRQRLTARGGREYPANLEASLTASSRYGHVNPDFSEPSYVDYLATSNDVYAAATLRARMMSGLPLRLYDGHDEDKKQIREGLAADILRKPNPFFTWPRLARFDELSMGIFGESFWAVRRGPQGPQEVWWLKSSRMSPKVHQDQYIAGWSYDVPGAQPLEFDTDEIVWFRYPNLADEFSPLAPLAAARLAADTAKSMQVSNKNIFDNGLNVGGFVSPGDDRLTFDNEQAEDLERMMDRRMRGADKAHRWQVLRFAAQFSKADMSLRDAEYVDGMNMSFRQVCRAFAVPSPLLNDMEHATLSNAREYERILWELGLVPDAVLRATEIECQFLPMFTNGPNHVEFGFDTVAALQESQDSVWTRERGELEMGTRTINEHRAAKGMPPVPWGDGWWAPVNKSLVISAEDSPEGDTSDGGGTSEAQEIVARVNAVGTLIRSGFDPAAALESVGLDPIQHLDYLPVTVQATDVTPLPAADETTGRALAMWARAFSEDARDAELLEQWRRELEHRPYDLLAQSNGRH